MTASLGRDCACARSRLGFAFRVHKILNMTDDTILSQIFRPAATCASKA